MKKAILLVLLLYAINSFGQNDKTTASPKPYITPAGDPFGDIVSAIISVKGGKLISADKGLEVIVPADALDSEVNISIQSAHNNLNENDEGAYRLEPSGIKFKKPVQLIFHYISTNENANLKGIGWQDDTGQWHYLKKVITDTIQKTITALALHFSTWARFDKLFIKPAPASLKVTKSIKLVVYSFSYGSSAPDDNDILFPPGVNSDNDILFPPAPINSDDDILFPPSPAAPNDDDILFPPLLFYTADWTVNGILPGNEDVGIVTKKNNSTSMYQAPATVPGSNPVAVSVKVYSAKNRKTLLLTSNITIIGGKYHFTYIHIDEGDGCFALVDSSSCIVNLDGDNPAITNIINYPPWSDWPNCDKCRWEWTNKETVKGLVEINGLASSVITPPRNRGGVTNVNMTLVPATGSTPSAIAHCKNGDHTIPSHPLSADPKYINFDIIDRDNVTIHFGGKSGTNELVIQGHNEKTMIYMYRVN